MREIEAIPSVKNKCNTIASTAITAIDTAASCSPLIRTSGFLPIILRRKKEGNEEKEERDELVEDYIGRYPRYNISFAPLMILSNKKPYLV